MKALVYADTHIGAGADHRRDALADQDANLDLIATLAVDRGVDLMLNGGDTFHRPKPGPAELHVFDRFVRRVARAGIPTIAVLGNNGHDQGGAGQPAAVELFEAPLFRVSRHPEVITEFCGVSIATLPSVSVANLVAAAGGGDRGEIHEIAAALLIETAQELRDFVHTDVAGLLGHWSVSGAMLPTGLPVADLHEPVLPLDAIEALGFDFAAFGHIHRPGQFDEGTAPVFYTGPPMAHTFSDAGFEHGVWIVELLGDEPPEFVPLTDRRFVTVTVDLEDSSLYAPSGDDEPLDETDVVAYAIIAEHPLADSVLRVTYRGTEEQHRRVNHEALAGLCADAGVHRVYGGFHWDPVRTTRARVEGVDESLSPLDAVDLWLAANDVDETRADGLRSLTAEYLADLAS